ncbi:MAG: serine/threonine protein kinase [Pirellula sp.]|jgi:serine/threonine protein kinase
MNLGPLEKFLQGTADEHETRQSETILSQSETLFNDPLPGVNDDSLIASLRQDISIDQDDETAIRLMSEQLARTIPRTDITTEEIKSLFDPPPSNEFIGRIGKYLITEYLASGGMGLVFRATDSELNRDVCLKLLHPSRAKNLEARTRFERETLAIARLTSDRIMPVLDLGTHRDLPYHVMPLLPGRTLRTVLLNENSLPPTRALRIAIQIAEGLDLAHGNGILHRDIKPDNLWISPSDDVKLIDFGLARTLEEATPITHEGTVLGTPSYMSPEQITGQSLDERSDLFSLGVVLMEMLCGESPFRKNNLFSTLMSVASEKIDFAKLDPENKIPNSIRSVVLCLLQKDPNLRPQDAAAVVTLLKATEQAAPPECISIPMPDLAGDFGNRRWSRFVATALGGFACCLTILAVWKLGDKGTLVVETNDPDVEVKIAGEQVSVKDPLTNKAYTIRIGNSPLPSGVYQLEMNDLTGELVFSSQTIAIRRGEKTILSVQLKPKSEASHLDSNEPITAPDIVSDSSSVNESEAGFIPELKQIPRDQIKDASYDPEARDRFGEILRSLPALNLEEHLPNEKYSFSPVVTNPTKLPAIDTWTMDRIPQDAKWFPNCDRSLFVAVGQHAWVVDANGTPKYVLPTRGQLFDGRSVETYFDTAHPNLIATASWEGTPALDLDIGKENPPDQTRIHVWRLGPEGAELIRSFLTSYGFAWDKGYRIFHVSNGNVVTTRIDTGETTVLMKHIEGRWAPLNVSPGGRFLAVHSGGLPHTNVYDLHRNEFVSTIRLNGRIQWHQDDAAIGVVSYDRDSLEIWKTDESKLLQRIDLAEKDSSQSSSRDLVIPAIDPQFRRVAFVNKNQEYSVRSLVNQRESLISWESFPRPKSGSMDWQSDGSLAIFDDKIGYRWRPTDSEVQGVLTVDESFISPSSSSGRLTAKWPDNLIGNAGNQLVFDSTQSLPKDPFSGQAVGMPGVSPSITSRAQKTQSTIVKFDNLLSGTDSHFQVSLPPPLVPRTLSPNGRFSCQLAREESGRTRIKLFDVMAGTTHEMFDGEGRDLSSLWKEPLRDRITRRVAATSVLLWTPDSRFVLYSGSDYLQSEATVALIPQPFASVYDTGSQRELSFDRRVWQSAFSRGHTVRSVAVPSGFVLSIQRIQAPWDESYESSSLLYLLQPTTGQITEIRQTGVSLTGWNLAEGLGEYLLFSKTGTKDTETVWMRVRIENDELVDPKMITCVGIDRLVSSPNGERFCLLTFDPRVYSATQNTNFGMQYSIDRKLLRTYPFTASVWNWDQVTGGKVDEIKTKPIVAWKPLDNESEIVWHPQGLYLSIFGQGTTSLIIMDTDSGSWKHNPNIVKPTDGHAVRPIQDGWLALTPDTLQVMELDGELRKTFLLGTMTEASLESPGSGSGCWILANGETSKPLPQELNGQLHFLSRRDNRVMVEPYRSDLPSTTKDQTD